MPVRTIPLVAGEYYHVYNRGVAHQPIYNSKKDHERFLTCLAYYQHNKITVRLSKFLQLPVDERESLINDLKKQNDKIIELIAFCLMSNHFHLLIKQVSDNGISKFLRLVCNSYAKYFNIRHERDGSIFQGMFKVVHIKTNEQLLHVSRYIHLNPLVSYLVRESDFLSYPWSSLKYYLEDGPNSIVNPKVILEQFSLPKGYLDFVLNQADYGKELERIKHLTLE